MPTIPLLPLKGEAPWYDKRKAFDDKVAELTLNAQNRLALLEVLGGLEPGDVSDATVTAIGEDPDSLLAKFLEKTIDYSVFKKTKTLVIETFYEVGDTDDQTWQRAFDYSVAHGGRHSFLATKEVYAFAASVNPLGLVNSTITGLGKFSTVIKAAPGAGDLIAAFYSPPGASSKKIERLVFEKLRFDGSMTGIYVGHVRDRTFAEDRISAAIYLSGNLVPTEISNPSINGIVVKDCSFFGMESLPVHIRGAQNATLDNCELVRCLDPGWIHTKSVYVIHNKSIWSADNGFSVSRGCTEVFVDHNDVFGAFFAGIHAGGFGDEQGAKKGMITHNTVINSGMYGISAEEGSDYLIIALNYIEGVLRGVGSWASDSNSVMYGAGIKFGGVHTNPAEENNILGYSHLAMCIKVFGNIINGADRFGIVWYGTIDASVTDNDVFDIGSERMIDGSLIPVDNSYRNVGIGPFRPRAGSTFNTKSTDNRVHDRRPVPFMNFGLADLSSINPYRHGNVVSGSRNDYFENWDVNGSINKISNLDMDSRAGQWRQIVSREDGAVRGRLRWATSSNLEAVVVDNDGTEFVATSLGRLSKQMSFFAPPKLPVYTTANLPSSTTSGVGAMVYDSTRDKVLVSTGSLWRTTDNIAP